MQCHKVILQGGQGERNRLRNTHKVPSWALLQEKGCINLVWFYNSGDECGRGEHNHET